MCLKTYIKAILFFYGKLTVFMIDLAVFPQIKKPVQSFLMNRFFVPDLSVFVPNLLIFVPGPRFYGFLLSEFLCRWHP